MTGGNPAADAICAASEVVGPGCEGAAKTGVMRGGTPARSVRRDRRLRQQEGAGDGNLLR